MKEKILTGIEREISILEDIQKDFGAVELSNDISLDFLPNLNDSPAVFCEVEIPGGYLECCERVIIYRFDRTYPFDVALPEDFYNRFNMVEKTEFVGNSHDKIFKEIWEKK